jgi:hypothetical protein
MIQSPTERYMDGIRLDCFQPDGLYEIGPALASLFIAEGWAEPVILEEPGQLSLASETVATPAARPNSHHPRNLVRETEPPHFDHVGRLGVAFERPRRRRRSVSARSKQQERK